MIRKPVVSGQFYPGSEDELKKAIAALAGRPPVKIAAKGVILPHAGYIYSGKTAVTTVSQVLARPRLIILGPNHTGRGEDFSLWARGAWGTPLGEIDIDEELAALILAQDGNLKEDYFAHQREHSIEVELPILNFFFGEFKFVPIVCQTASLEDYQRAAVQICAALKGISDQVLFVASTDMTHDEPDSAARQKDRGVIERILDLDEEGLVREVNRKNISMCGVAPVAVFISCMKRLGARKAQVALYQTSGDASGNYRSVVGYAGMIIK